MTVLLVGLAATCTSCKTTIVGLNKQGEDYVNDAFGRAKKTVRLTVQAAVGEVNLEVAP